MQESKEKKETNKIINKPITVSQSELADKIIDDINTSGLHPALIMPIIEEIYMMMKKTLKETREKEKTEYANAISGIAEK